MTQPCKAAPHVPPSEGVAFDPLPAFVKPAEPNPEAV